MKDLLARILGPDYAHHVIIGMGVGSLCAQCAAAIHTAWHGGTIDHQAFGIGAASIIGATGAALGLGTKRDGGQ